jgi:hypothetical protein
MVGVIAMHAFGHRGHNETQGETAVVAHHVALGEEAGAPIADHEMGHDGDAEAVAVNHRTAHGGDGNTPEPSTHHEDDPLGALSMLGFMICGGVLLRVAFEVLRLVWPRLLASLAALPAVPAFRALSTRFRPPPPRLRPTSLLLNRIAVLRI